MFFDDTRIACSRCGRSGPDCPHRSHLVDSDQTRSLVSRFSALHAAAKRPVKPELLLTQLTHEALAGLIHGDYLALRIPGFVPAREAEEIGSRLLRAQVWGRYADPGVTGIEISGDALFSCGGNRECPNYFANARRSRRAVRDLLRPLSSPIDVVQAELDAAWVPGASVLTLNGQKCHVGLQRCFKTGGDAAEHTDRARVDFAHQLTAEFRLQLAMNVYLRCTGGGELDLWTIEPSDEDYELARNRTGKTYALRGGVLPPPDHTITPHPGDLIVFNAARIHRVRPVAGPGERVTVSGFAGYRDEHSQLLIFS